MNGKDAKEVDDLSNHYEWMVGRARMRGSGADAEDIANRALYDAHHPTGERPAASDVPRVKLWLDELIQLRVRAHKKIVKKREAEVLSDKVHSIVRNSMDTDVEARYENREWLRVALDSLPQDRRELIVQCYVEEIPIEEVARSLGVKKNTLHTWLRKIREDLRFKLGNLLRTSGRRLRILFPFLFIRWWWQRMVAPASDWCARGIRHSVKGVFVAPGPLVLGAGAAVLVLGFAPSDPRATASERLAQPSYSTEHRDRVVQSVERVESTPGTAVSLSVHRAQTVAPAPVIIKAVQSAPTAKHSAVFDEDSNQLGLLIEVKAALNKRHYEKALELIALQEARYPNSRYAGKCEALRAIAEKALAARK